MSENSLISDDICISLSKFIEQMGITDTTAWRWRKVGMLKTENICGRQYVYPSEIARFNERVKSGEFAKKHKTPNKSKSDESAHSE
jgi:hypothetical protein